jgi:hypothetical protein
VNQRAPTAPATLPALVAAGECAGIRFLEFVAGQHPRPAPAPGCYRAAEVFLAWSASANVPSIGAVQPVHVATWIETGTRELATPSVKLRLAAIRHLFDWLVTGQVVSVNPAASVRGGVLPVSSLSPSRKAVEREGDGSNAIPRYRSDTKTR